jgi:magnesium chelatase family protein
LTESLTWQPSRFVFRSIVSLWGPRARRLVTILPDMALDEAIETTRIHRVAGLTSRHPACVTPRPCRAPHYTIADVGWIGGGPAARSREGSLAHYGILRLNERPACNRQILEGLRRPLKERLMILTRA